MSKARKIFYGTLVALVAIAVLAGIFSVLRAAAKKQYSVPILMYHEIGETTNSAWCVPVETFRSQMTSLREQGFKTILPSDITAHFRWGRPLPPKPVIITFDDGYLSNLKIVEPILKKNDLRAIAYLITGQVAETAVDRRQYEGKDCLVWPEVLAMQKRRIFAFGGHAHTHKNLAVDPNPLLQTTECRRQLVLHGIREPDSFCYPHGEYNQATIKAVKQAGFQTAVVCEDAVASIGPATNLFALPRVSVMGGSHEFKLASKRVEDKEKALICRVFHAGIPLEISACLSGKDNDREIWLPKRAIGQEEFELRFILPDDLAGQGKSSFIEIWDKHRLFKLATIQF
ncbi:MAG: polysaccharide deacetylase family protein [Kiritimatiellia bacterium]|nr:polysaccharide deacetylase family protein [Kiritimatiellia bacterium]